MVAIVKFPRRYLPMMALNGISHGIPDRLIKSSEEREPSIEVEKEARELT